MDTDSNKIRILYLKDFFEEYTDEEHSASMYDIQKYLKLYSYEPTQKTIIDDIKALNKYGMEIQLDEGGRKRHLVTRRFEIAEVKMLIDCIASSKFLPEEKSKQLIKKLGELVSLPQRWALTRRVKVSDRFRSANKTVLYGIDTILTAINNNLDIQFKYYQYNMNKEQVLRNNGEIYQIHPRDLLYDDNLYYVVAYLNEKKTTYRVDKMTDIQVLESNSMGRRDRLAILSEKCSKKEKIQMLFNKDMMDDVIDKFGKDVNTEIVDDVHFRVKIELIPDFQFYSWIFGLGDKVMIEYPLAIAAQMMDLLQERYRAYREGHSRNIYYYRHKDNKVNQLKVKESTSVEPENDE